MNEEKTLPLYYLCLSKLLTFYCGYIQTQRSYRKENISLLEISLLQSFQKKTFENFR